jgi:hypothetical protein
MYKGECLCGAVKYAINASIDTIECCHCLTCRKAHASAFAIGVTIKRANFNLLAGNSHLAEFESSKGKLRVFCNQCGSHIYAYRPTEPLTLRLRPALLNTDLSQFQIKHIYTATRLCL